MTYLYALFYNGGHDLVDTPEEAQRLFEEYNTSDENTACGGTNRLYGCDGGV